MLDSIRAVQHILESNRKIRTALSGYSGGSLASLWALELQASYAPELILPGAAVGGLVPNSTHAFPVIDGSYFAGLVPAYMLGITSQSDAAREELLDQLKPETVSKFLSALDLSISELFEPFQFENFSTAYFINGFDMVLKQPAIRYVLDNNGYLGYHGIPQVPIFAHHAIKDELAAVEDADHLVEKVYCRLGVDVRYERNRAGKHYPEASNQLEREREFLKEVLGRDGKEEMVPVGGGCTIVDVTVGEDAPLQPPI